MRASAAFLFGGIAFLVLAIVQLTWGGERFAVLLAVALGNFAAALIFRARANSEYLVEERPLKREKATGGDIKEDCP